MQSWLALEKAAPSARSPRLGAFVCVALTTALALAGCGSDDEADRSSVDEARPVARFTATPAEGVAPHEVTFDASTSSDAADALAALRFRWDFDGDGTWDTEALASLVTTVSRYSVPGSYAPRLEVTNTHDASDVARDTVTLVVTESTSPVANIDVDTNRDGVISASDDAGEDLWQSGRGAVTLANIDDDDQDGARDWRDESMNGTADREDLTELVLHRMNGLSTAHRVELVIEPEAAAVRSRLFRAEAPNVPLASLSAAPVVLDRAALSAGDVTLWLETITGRSQQWDGRTTLRARVMDGSTLVSEDVVQLQAAPFIFTDDLQPAERMFVLRIADRDNGPNLPFVNALTAALPASIALQTASEWDYQADRWLQDNMQPGYQSRPRGDTVQVMRAYLQTERPGGLEAFVPDEVLAPGVGFSYPGGNATSLNYGGNLELAPPHSADGKAWTFGRFVLGGGNNGTLTGQPYADRMTERQRLWLEKQEMQGPVIELSTEWLAVGHIDEIIMFVPDKRPGAARPFKVVIASPDLARRTLGHLADEGLSALPVFAGREVETTVGAILADTQLMAFNRAAQTRIDTVRGELAAAIGLTGTDFLEVPVLYEPIPMQGLTLAAAYNPGIQNLVIGDTVLFLPDPEGPEASGKDAWKQVTEEALAPLGLDLVWVDVFESYHLLMGEAHCGTNVQRTPYGTAWWTP